jgi:hypothetical protein
MLAMMLIAQITVISDTPRPAADEALRILRTSRSLANQTDVVVADSRDMSTPVVRSRWRPGDGPFGPFTNRLSRLQVTRGSSFAASRRIYSGGRPGPRIPRLQPVRLSVRLRPPRIITSR